jgi:hypothetical protein
VTITTDQPIMKPEDRPTELNEPLHLDPPAHSRPATKPLRTAFGWILSIVVIAAALLVAAIVDADGTDTSVNHVVVTERGNANDGDSPLTDTVTDAHANPPTEGIAAVENGPTELDVRGIPTWWSGQEAAPGGIAPVDNGLTELDVRGIPAWWSGEEAAREHNDATDRPGHLPADNHGAQRRNLAR